MLAQISDNLARSPAADFHINLRIHSSQKHSIQGNDENDELAEESESFSYTCEAVSSNERNGSVQPRSDRRKMPLPPVIQIPFRVLEIQHRPAGPLRHSVPTYPPFILKSSFSSTSSFLPFKGKKFLCIYCAAVNSSTPVTGEAGLLSQSQAPLPIRL